MQPTPSAVPSAPLATTPAGVPLKWLWAAIAALGLCVLALGATLVAQQRLGDGLGRGADVQDQRAVVRHLFGHGAGNAGFALGVQGFSLGVGQVLHGGAGHAHAAMKAGEQA